MTSSTTYTMHLRNRDEQDQLTLAVLNSSIQMALSSLADWVGDLVPGEIESIFGQTAQLPTNSQDTPSPLDISAWETLQTAWQQGDFSELPTIEILLAAELNQANGAYAESTDTIYLSEEFIQVNAGNPGAIAAVLLEEIGHYVDAQINVSDTVGDEGAHFAAVVQGIELSEETLAAIQSENDTSTIEVAGETVSVENSDPYAGENLDQLQTGLTTFLNKLEETLSERVLNTDMPLIGQNLQSLVNLFQQVHDEINEHLGGLDGTSTVAQVQQALFEIFGPNGVGWLEDDEGQPATEISAIAVTELTDDVRFNFALGYMPDAIGSIALENDLGLPGLQLSVEGEAQANLDLNLNIGFGVNTTDGFYLDTSADEDVSLGIAITTPGLEVTTGALGLLDFIIRDEADDDGDDVDPTQVQTTFSLDLGNEQISLANLSSLTATNLADISVEGDAEINLNLEANLGTSALPSIDTDLNIDWNLSTGTPEDPAAPLVLGTAPSVSFNNAKLNLGSFFNNFVSPIFGQVQNVTNTFPIKPLTDVLQTRIPVLDDLGRNFLDVTGGITGGPDNEVTFLDVIKWLNPEASIEYISAISAFSELANSVPTGGDLSIDLGGFTLGGGGDIRNQGFSLDQGIVENVAVIESVTEQLEGLLGEDVSEGIGEAIAAAQNFFDSPDENTVDLAASTALSFPLLENPTHAFNLLLNQPVDLFLFNVPELSFEQDFSVFFPIIGPLGGLIEGGFGASIDLDVGFDTSGLLGGGGNFLDGFYITTENGAPIANLNAGLNAYGALNFVALSAGIGGGIHSNLDLYLNDGPDNDGKVHLNEFNPSCIFDPVSGEVTAGLDAFVEIGFSPFVYRKRFNLAKATLLSFELGCAGHGQGGEPPNYGLAEDIGGMLWLNMGPRAHLRDDSVPNTDIEEWFTLQVSPETGSIQVSAFGATQEYDNITGIQADGGAEADSIAIADEVTLNATLSGGTGNDLIYGGSGNDSLSGGADSDALEGGAGSDTLEGGAGSDDLEGGEGADLINGGEGAEGEIDRVTYQSSEVGVSFAPDPEQNGAFIGSGGDAEGDQLLNVEYIEGSNFDDSLVGDDGMNILEGLSGDDTLLGQGGDDFLIGGKGADSIDGGSGSGDATTYITSSAEVYVNLQSSNAFSGDAEGDTLLNIEHVQGSVYSDILIGNNQANRLGGKSGDDSLDGNNSADTLLGGDGDDTLDGGANADSLDGGDGKDWAVYNESNQSVNVNLDTGTGAGGHANGDQLIDIENLEGSNHNDTLTGNSQSNILSGRTGNDDLESGAGNDTVIGGMGADSIHGGTGIDLADYSASFFGVDVNLFTDFIGSASTASGGDANGDQLSAIENLKGSNFVDTLTGSVLSNDIDPGLSIGGTDIVHGGANLTGRGDRLLLDYSSTIYTLNGGYDYDTESTHAGLFVGAVEFTGIEHLQIIASYTDDSIRGGGGDDFLLLGGGDDTVFGGQGNNYILADDGDDTITNFNNAAGEIFDFTPTDEASIFWIDGGAGIDRFSGNLSHRLENIVLISEDPDVETNQTQLSLQDGSYLHRIEIFQDLLTGDGDDYLVQGGRVDNQFETGSGSDTVNAGIGFDVVDGGHTAGSVGTQVQPDESIDTLVVDYSQEDIGGGLISEITKPNTGRYYRYQADGETLLDEVQFTRFEQAHITGTQNMDWIGGLDGDDELQGLQGNDLILAGNGDDLVSGGQGDDILLEYLVLNDRFTAGNDTMAGSSGNDWAIGGFGHDSLQGDAGNDALIGGAGYDTLNGGEGNDSIVGINFGAVPSFGTPEIDQMTGGDGADEFWLGDGTYVYYDDENALTSGTQHRAVIHDFNPGSGDVIQLHGSANDYTLTTSGKSTIVWHKGFVAEQIAIVQGALNLDLNESYFRYVDDEVTDPSETLVLPTLPSEPPPGSFKSFAVASTGTLSQESIVSALAMPAAESLPLVIAEPSVQAIQATTPIVQEIPSVQAATPISQEIPSVPAVAQIDFASPSFNINQAFTASQLTQTFFGDTTGLEILDTQLTGDARAFGTFSYDPFGLGSGIVLSTGKVIDLVGENLEDGGVKTEQNLSLNFVKLEDNGDFGLGFGTSNGGQGSDPGETLVANPKGSDDEGNTAIYRANLSEIDFGLRSLTIADSGVGGGAPGDHSGFDLSGIKISTELINDVKDIDDIPGLDVFDFSPLGTYLNPGTQRPSNNVKFPVAPDLAGTIHGQVNNAIATLGEFDYNEAADTGFVSLGEEGSISFNLDSLNTDGPLYLYIEEAGNNGESPDGDVTVSNQRINDQQSLSTDFGLPGTANDTTKLEFTFHADESVDQVYFQFVFGSEEFVEFGGDRFNDVFNLKLNGLNLARLSDGSTTSINTLVPNSYGGYHPDFIHNPVGEGPASDQTPLDGFTQVLTFVGDVDQNSENHLEIEVKDIQDGWYDSAVFLRAGSFGVSDIPQGGFQLIAGESVHTEGGSAPLYLNLTTVPEAPVVITLDPDEEVDFGQGAGVPIDVTFTPENALETRTIGGMIVDDSDVEGGHFGTVTATASSDDPSYSNLSSFDLQLDIADNDQGVGRGPDQLTGQIADQNVVGLEANESFSTARTESLSPPLITEAGMSFETNLAGDLTQHMTLGTRDLVSGVDQSLLFEDASALGVAREFQVAKPSPVPIPYPTPE